MPGIYNTLTRQKEQFTPLTPPKVTMYVCGPTVYSDCHLGHARAYFTFDIVYRALRAAGYQVTYARNITDIDDKIIDRANKSGQSVEALVRTTIRSFHDDMAALRILPPTIEPRATEHIPQMIDLISTLIGSDKAYSRNGDVYFRVRKFPTYGKLSQKSLDDLASGARIEIGEQKDDPLDFALWKASKPGEPSWPSPWGPGRPGWHIECSAMSMKHLGTPIDIHGGGIDLVFPHHENEIAQSEAATHAPFARFWIHNGHVMVNREKMAKSLGNFFTIKEILATVHPEVVRCYALSSHYRSPIDFARENVEATRVSLVRLYSRLAEMETKLGPGAEMNAGKIYPADGTLTPLALTVWNFLEDDFNTAAAIGSVFSAVKEAHQKFQAGELRSDEWELLRRSLRQLSSWLGLFGERPSEFLSADEKFAKSLPDELTSEEVEQQILLRSDARKNRNFAEADRIRKMLEEKGILLEDSSGGTTWRRAR